jgi:MoaA/NifB/PqqE/SkfB family radical SAM enzyme
MGGIVLNGSKPLRVVDYMITGVCNLACPFCYGPDPLDKSALSEDQASTMIGFLHDHGIRGMVIAGGEPTMSPNLKAVIEMANQNDMWTAVQSNGTKPAVLIPLLRKLAWLALPLDSVTVSGGQVMRTTGRHLQTTFSLAHRSEVLEARAAGMQLKIGTVLTRINVTELEAIANVVCSISPDVWKIYQLRPRGAGRINEDQLSLSDGSFHAATADIVSRFPSLKIAISSAKESLAAYLIINPDSTLLIPKWNRYLSYGRLVDSRGCVDARVWYSAIHGIDENAHIQNMTKSFPLASPYSEGAHDGDNAQMDDVSVTRVTPTEVMDRDGR